MEEQCFAYINGLPWVSLFTVIFDELSKNIDESFSESFLHCSL